MKTILTTCICLVYTCGAFAQQAETKKLSLQDAIFQALKANLDVQIEMANPEIADLSVSKAYATIFTPQLSAAFTKMNSTAPAKTSLDTTGSGSSTTVSPLSTSDNMTIDLSLKQTLAIGSTLSIDLNNNRQVSSALLNTFNPSLSSTLTFSFTQPLLKNFGTFITKRSIYVNANNQQKAVLQLKFRIMDVINQVEQAYWNLVYAHQAIDVNKKSLEASRDLLKQNELQVKVGVSAPMDILSAKAEVANNERLLLQAQSTLQTAQENIKRILNLVNINYTIEPSDQPNMAPMKTDFNQFLLDALQKRPEVEQARIDLQNMNLDVRYYRNQMLPDLQVVASYRTSGLSGDKILRAGSDFNSPVIGVESHNIWESMKDVVSNLYPNWSISLNLNLPLSNEAAHADLASAQINMKKGLLQLKNVENGVFSDVKQATLDIETNQKIVEASLIARQLSEEKLNAEQKKLAVGLSTNYQVLLMQRDLESNRISELQALIQYNIAIAKLNKVTGSTFEKYNIQFSDFIKTH